MKIQIRAIAIAVALCIGILAGIVALQRNRSTPLPVLMYHHFTQEITADTCVSPDAFRSQLTALKEAGFTSVTLSQVMNYVKWGVPLPEKPVLITMDDGYTSNITIAAPILEELGMCATVFVIGVYEGDEINFRTGNPLYPQRLSYEEAAPWVEKGVLDLQCHSFDMHQKEADGFSGRDGMRQLATETPEEYAAAVREDIRQFRQHRDGLVETPLLGLSYPYGYCSPDLDSLVQKENIPITFTIVPECSRLRVWDESSLRMLGRYNVTEYWYPGDLVATLLEAWEA